MKKTQEQAAKDQTIINFNKIVRTVIEPERLSNYEKRLKDFLDTIYINVTADLHRIIATKLMDFASENKDLVYQVPSQVKSYDIVVDEPNYIQNYNQGDGVIYDLQPQIYKICSTTTADFNRKWESLNEEFLNLVEFNPTHPTTALKETLTKKINDTINYTYEGIAYFVIGECLETILRIEF